jgi:hypothetical protein
MTVGEEILERRRRIRRAGDPRLSAKGREVLYSVTVGALAKELQEALDADAEADPLLGTDDHAD